MNIIFIIYFEDAIRHTGGLSRRRGKTLCRHAVQFSCPARIFSNGFRMLFIFYTYIFNYRSPHCPNSNRETRDKGVSYHTLKISRETRVPRTATFVRRPVDTFPVTAMVLKMSSLLSAVQNTAHFYYSTGSVLPVGTFRRLPVPTPFQSCHGTSSVCCAQRTAFSADENQRTAAI